MVDILVDSEGKALTTGGKAIKATGGATDNYYKITINNNSNTNYLYFLGKGLINNNVDVIIPIYFKSPENSCVFYIKENTSLKVLRDTSMWEFNYNINGGNTQTSTIIDGYYGFVISPNSNTVINIIWTNSCVLENTNVIMSDNTSKQIKDINIGDKILGYDENNHSTTEVDVLNVHQHSVNKIYEIITSNNDSIKVTSEHLLLSDKGWSAINVKSSSLAYSNVNIIQQLNVGDKLIDKDNNEQTITNINEITGQFNVYTLDVTNEIDTFITNNYISHNKN